MQKVVGFLKGWLVTAIFSMAFAAMGWIEIGADFAFAHILVPIIMGFLIWLMIYISCLVVWVVVLLATGLLFFFGGGLVLAGVGYLCLKFAQFISDGMFTFAEDNGWSLFVMGLIYALIIFVDPTRRKMMSNALD
mgnify:FL=1|jgi:hypothetical protein